MKLAEKRGSTPVGAEPATDIQLLQGRVGSV